ncbi:hypothetical protein PAAG_04900 [Paracoccidioides lutzii Pb01]|uniref:Protein kinase domain-containing protein n=1 Tax=Paracoccidioides lutzii (strain ATCC MYA-826 / Pb01) TaxID=502779 RepID=C1H1W4_PARBA|nr:hypothetical protein PAAG_04900 [Paracoccidioides lutzii Pb01]EEH33851.2 hypothetical protein PAAG_04900 [Paracoccidioides lutzii Pb01]
MSLVQPQPDLALVGFGAAGLVYEVGDDVVFKTCQVEDILSSDTSGIARYQNSEFLSSPITFGWTVIFYAFFFIFTALAFYLDLRIGNELFDKKGRAILCDFSAATPFGQSNGGHNFGNRPLLVTGSLLTVSDATDRFTMGSLFLHMEHGTKAQIFVDRNGNLALPEIGTGHQGIDTIIRKACLGERMCLQWHFTREVVSLNLPEKSVTVVTIAPILAMLAMFGPREQTTSVTGDSPTRLRVGRVRGLSTVATWASDMGAPQMNLPPRLGIVLTTGPGGPKFLRVPAAARIFLHLSGKAELEAT